MKKGRRKELGKKYMTSETKEGDEEQKKEKKIVKGRIEERREVEKRGKNEQTRERQGKSEIIEKKGREKK